MPQTPYLVYCLVSTGRKKTYVGCTNNFHRRLRQHNGEIKGGARYTRGGTWKPLFHVTGLDHREALQLEWAMKKRRARGVSGPEGRWKTLSKLMALPRWTRNAPLIGKIRHRLKIVRFEK
jgi:predicted GIY-YIG superfamily endonuclease